MNPITTKEQSYTVHIAMLNLNHITQANKNLAIANR